MRTNERGEHLSAADLAERIAHYAKVRLCDKVDGEIGYTDYLLGEHDRYLICRALRSFQED